MQGCIAQEVSYLNMTLHSSQTLFVILRGIFRVWASAQDCIGDKYYLMNPGASAFPVACCGVSERLE